MHMVIKKQEVEMFYFGQENLASGPLDEFSVKKWQLRGGPNETKYVQMTSYVCSGDSLRNF